MVLPFVFTGAATSVRSDVANDTPTARERPREMQQCIEDCLDLFAISKETVAYCLSEGGELAGGRLITTLLTTSDVCRITSECISIEAQLFQRSAGYCAEVADFCASSCDAFADEQLGACAEAARACADSARAVAAMDFSAERGRFEYD
jgi:hypothetical protein